MNTEHIDRLWFVPIILAIASCARQNDILVTTSVCAAVSSAAALNGRIVRIHATIQSDGLHGSALTDESCKKGIVIVWPAQRNPRVNELRNVLFHSVPPGTLDKDVRATLTGTFRASADREGADAIELADVDGISVRNR